MAKFRFNRITIKYFLALAIPLALQNLVTTAVNLADNVMVGKLGDSAIASVNQANQFFFVYSMIIFGICSGSSVFIAQFWGKRDYTNIRRIAGLGTMFGLFVGLIFAALSIFSSLNVMSILSTDSDVIKQGSSYLKILTLSYPLTAIALSAAHLLKSVGNVKIPLFASVVAILTNVFFNWVFIYGNLGAPALGVNGAAYATLIARVIEFSIIIYGALNSVDFLRKNMKDYIKIPKETIKYFINISTPVILNETAWGLGTSLYTVIYARIGNSPEEGTAALAAIHITLLAEKLASVFIFGMGHAIGILVGNEIGSRRNRRAEFSAYQVAYLAPILGSCFAFLMVVFSPLYVMLFNVSLGVALTAKRLIFILAVIMPIKNFNLVNIVGTLRGGGDTSFSCLLDIGGVWFLSLPLIFVCALILKLPIEIVYATSLFEEVIKAILIYQRLKKRKWINDLVNV